MSASCSLTCSGSFRHCGLRTTTADCAETLPCLKVVDRVQSGMYSSCKSVTERRDLPRRCLLPFLCSSLLITTGAAARAQSPAQEEESSQPKKAKKVYTNDDFPSSPPASKPQASRGPAGGKPVRAQAQANPSAGMSFRERRKAIAALEMEIAQTDETVQGVNSHENPGMSAFMQASQARLRDEIQKLRDGPPPLPPTDLPPAITLDEKKMRYFSYLTDEERQQRISQTEELIASEEKYLQTLCKGSETSATCAPTAHAIDQDRRDLELLRRTYSLPPEY